MPVSIKGLLIAFAVLPAIADGGILINEVMYDVPGSDDGREWVEIWNTEAGVLPLTSLRFADSGGRHLLRSTSGAAALPSGCFVITSDIEKFKIDHPSYNGPLITSSFNLLNSGDALSLVQMANSRTVGTIFDSLNYSKTMGAAGDGNSLHRTGQTLILAAESPGVCDATASQGAVGAVGSVDKATSTPETKPAAKNETNQAPDSSAVQKTSTSAKPVDAVARKAVPVVVDESLKEPSTQIKTAEKESPKEQASSTVLYAAAADASGKNTDWLLALGGLVGIAVLGVIFSSRRSKGQKGEAVNEIGGKTVAETLSADDFKILELKDE